MVQSTPSDELQNRLGAILAKSRKLRKQADEIDAEVEHLKRLVEDNCGPPETRKKSKG